MEWRVALPLNHSITTLSKDATFKLGKMTDTLYLGLKYSHLKCLKNRIIPTYPESDQNVSLE